METYRRLIEFCERIEKGGKEGQQYVAQGIRALMKAEGKKELFPPSFPEKGYIVECKNGSKWIVEEALFRCSLYEPAPIEDKPCFTVKNMPLFLSSADIASGEISLYGKIEATEEGSEKE